MADESLITTAKIFTEARRRPSRTTAFVRILRGKPLGTAGGIVILLMILLAIFAPLIAPFDPYDQRSDLLLAPSASHWFGTDRYGRDLLSRIIWGSQISLWVGIVSMGIGITAGSICGLTSGYIGRTVDNLIQRVMDVLMSLPALILAMAIVSVLGNSTTNVMIALGIVFTPGIARVVRGAVLSTKENQYVESARAIGCKHLRIVVVHILPNVLAPIIVLVTVGLGNAILAEASLSFLGLGTPEPTPSWGMDLNLGRPYWTMAWWTAIFAGLAISIVVFGLNLLGDALRDILDPRLKGTS